MKKIFIENFILRKIETLTTKKCPLAENVLEGGIIRPNITIISHSGNLECLSSDYLVNKESFKYGEGSSIIDKAIEIAFSCITSKETAHIDIEISGNYIDESHCGSIVKLLLEASYEIVSNAKYIYEYSAVEKLCIGKRYKQLSVDKINELSKSKYTYPVFLSGFYHLSRAIKWLALIDANELKGEDIKNFEELKIQSYNNLSYIHLSLENFERAIFAATYVLNKVPNNIKALYRRAVAQMNLQNYDLAFGDLRLLLKLDPSNVAAKKQLSLLTEKRKSLDKHYSEAMKKFLAFP